MNSYRLATFDVSYRGAPPVPAIVNPTRDELAEWLPTLRSGPRHVPWARWGLRSSGVLWFSDSYETSPTDDVCGRLTPEDTDVDLRAVLLHDASLVHGGLKVMGPSEKLRWEIKAHPSLEFDYFMKWEDVQTLLGCFPAWRRATAGVSLLRWSR